MKRSLRCAAALGLGMLLAAPAARAQTSAPPEQIGWTELLRLAREVSPRMALARQGVALAEADQRSADALPNPTFSYGYAKPQGSHPPFDGSRQVVFDFDMTLPKFGLRGARLQAADHALEAARAQVHASENSLIADAGAGFISLLLAQHELELLGASQGELQRLREVVAARRAGGVASEYELLRVDVEMASWSGRLAEAGAEVRSRQAELAVLLGFADWQPHAVGPLEDLLGELRIGDGEVDLSAHPALAAARQTEASAQARVTAAQRERLPELTFGVERTSTVAPFGASQNFVFGLELPFGDTRLGALQHARAEAESARLERRLLEAELGTTLQQQTALAEARRVILEQFEERVGQRLPRLQAMAESAYRLGKSSIAELLDATRTRGEVELEERTLQAQLAEARLRLAAARGELARDAAPITRQP